LLIASSVSKYFADASQHSAKRKKPATGSLHPKAVEPYRTEIGTRSPATLQQEPPHAAARLAQRYPARRHPRRCAAASCRPARGRLEAIAAELRQHAEIGDGTVDRAIRATRGRFWTAPNLGAAVAGNVAKYR
jgi:hypothetical protein